MKNVAVKDAVIERLCDIVIGLIRENQELKNLLKSQQRKEKEESHHVQYDI